MQLKAVESAIWRLCMRWIDAFRRIPRLKIWDLSSAQFNVMGCRHVRVRYTRAKEGNDQSDHNQHPTRHTIAPPHLMRVQKVAGITMSPKPSTEKGYCFDGSVRAGNRNLTGASILVATVICVMSCRFIRRRSKHTRPRKESDDGGGTSLLRSNQRH